MTKRRHKPGNAGQQAVLEALKAGYITEQQVKEFNSMIGKKAHLKKKLKKKPKARIFYGLNTNSM